MFNSLSAGRQSSSSQSLRKYDSASAEPERCSFIWRNLKWGNYWLWFPIFFLGDKNDSLKTRQSVLKMSRTLKCMKTLWIYTLRIWKMVRFACVEVHKLNQILVIGFPDVWSGINTVFMCLCLKQHDTPRKRIPYTTHNKYTWSILPQ